MDDLFSIPEVKEHYEERAAIAEHDGGLSKHQAESLARHECEVLWCMRTFYPNGQAMKAHFDLCEKKRGKPATDMLRNDVRKAWIAKGQV